LKLERLSIPAPLGEDALRLFNQSPGKMDFGLSALPRLIASESRSAGPKSLL